MNLHQQDSNRVIWANPNGQVPDGWIEKHAKLGPWLMSVWRSSYGHYEATLMHEFTYHRIRLGSREEDTLKSMCQKAESAARSMLN